MKGNQRSPFCCRDSTVCRGDVLQKSSNEEKGACHVHMVAVVVVVVCVLVGGGGDIAIGGCCIERGVSVS